MNGIFFSAKRNNTNEANYLSTFAKSGEVIFTEDISMALGLTSEEDVISWYNRYLKGDDFVQRCYHDFAIVTIKSTPIPTVKE